MRRLRATLGTSFAARCLIRCPTMLDDCIRDIRHGLRLLWRNPAFAAVVLGTLGVAMGATLTMFSVVDAWMVKPLNFPQADRLVVAFAATPERPRVCMGEHC